MVAVVQTVFVLLRRKGLSDLKVLWAFKEQQVQQVLKELPVQSELKVL
jgi:hypothetical protein